MILIEFEENLNYGVNIIKYKTVNDDSWYYMYLDIETLNLLIKNFGIIGLLRIPCEPICADQPTTGKEINLSYCGARIKMFCNENIPIDSVLHYIEQH